MQLNYTQLMSRAELQDQFSAWCDQEGAPESVTADGPKAVSLFVTWLLYHYDLVERNYGAEER